MAKCPTKRIHLFVAVNEVGEHCISEVGAQEALDQLVTSVGGSAFRVIDLDLDVLYASIEETKRRQLLTRKLKLVK